MSEDLTYLDNSNCECKKQIFATHDRYYLSPGGTPPNTVAYQLTNTFAGEGIDATNGYIHLVYSITNGTTGTPFGSDLLDYFASTHSGVIGTDIATIQAMINAALAEMGLSVGDVIYAVNTDNEPIFFLSPAAEAAIASNTYLHIYFGAVDTWNNYTQKADVTVLATNSTVLLGGSGETCTPIQEIKEKDSCTGEETYRYVIEDGNGQLLDASIVITNFDEANIKLECPAVVTPTIEYIPHVSGCIKRKTGVVSVVCNTSTTTYHFSDTDMVGFTITANDGNGNYTMIQEQSNVIAHDKFLALLQNVSQTNARTLEIIGANFLTFNYWSGNITNVVDYSPTEVQFEIHLEAGVTDTPPALTLPCIDSVPDAAYQNSASTLRGIYDPIPLNTQQLNGGTALVFIITNYTVDYDIVGGTETFIPAKQVVYKDIDGTFVEEYRSVGDINTLITFNPITDSFSVNCEPEPVIPPTLFEKEVCGTIDGSTNNFELIKIYTRDILGNSTLLHYEDKFGNIISGAVIEVCCDCDSLCEVTLIPVANRVCFGYATSFNGRDLMGDIILNGVEVNLEYLEVNNNVIINSTNLIGSTMPGFTSVDMGYGLAYNKIVDVLNTNSQLQNNGVQFVTAAAPYSQNGFAYDPMCWGVKYDDTKDTRIVMSIKILGVGMTQFYSFRLNPDPAQTYDCIGDARLAPTWDITDVQNSVAPAIKLGNCQLI